MVSSEHHIKAAANETRKKIEGILGLYLNKYPKEKERIFFRETNESEPLSAGIKVSEEDEESIITIKVMIIVFEYCFRKVKMGQDIKFKLLEPFFSYLLHLEPELERAFMKAIEILETIEQQKDKSVEPWMEHLSSIQLVSIEKKTRIQDWKLLILNFYLSMHSEILPWGVRYIHEYGQRPQMSKKERIIRMMKRNKNGQEDMSLYGGSFQYFPIYSFILLKYFVDIKRTHYEETANMKEATPYPKSELENALLKLVLVFWAVFVSAMTSTSREEQQMNIEEEEALDEDDSESDSSEEEGYDSSEELMKQLPGTKGDLLPMADLKKSKDRDPLQTHLTVTEIREVKQYISRIMSEYLLTTLVEQLYDMAEFEVDEINISQTELIKHLEGIRAHAHSTINSLVNCFGKELCELIVPTVLEDFEQTSRFESSQKLHGIKRNVGKPMWIVRQKALNTLAVMVRELLTTNLSYGSGFNGRTSSSEQTLELILTTFIDPFCQIILTEINKEAACSCDLIIKQTATLSCYSYSKIFSPDPQNNNVITLERIEEMYNNVPHATARITSLRKSIDYIKNQFKPQAVDCLKKSIFDKDFGLRDVACLALCGFITEMTTFSDELISEILLACKTYVQNFSRYSMLISALTEKLNQKNSIANAEQYATVFNELMEQLFMRICKSDNLIEFGITSEEEKQKLIVCLFDSLYDTMEFLKHKADIKLLEHFVVFAKDRILATIDNVQEKDKADDISAFSTTIFAIIRNSNPTVLKDMFKRHDMYNFLTTFIRKTVRHTNLKLKDCGILSVGTMSNGDLFKDCPFDTNDLSMRGDLLYDYLLPIIMEESIVSRRFYEETTLDDDELIKKKIVVYHNAVWSLGRIILNEHRKGSKDPRLMQCVEQAVPRLVLVLRMFADKDFYTTEDVIDDITGYLSNVCITLSYISLIRIDLVGPHYLKFAPSFIEHVISDSIEVSTTFCC